MLGVWLVRQKTLDLLSATHNKTWDKTSPVYALQMDTVRFAIEKKRPRRVRALSPLAQQHSCKGAQKGKPPSAFQRRKIVPTIFGHAESILYGTLLAGPNRLKSLLLLCSHYGSLCFKSKLLH
jgi:hypothetical protein